MTSTLRSEIREDVEFIEQPASTTLCDQSGHKKARFALKNYYGLFLALLSAFFLAISNVCIKNVRILSGSEQSTVRYVFQLLIMGVILVRQTPRLHMLGESSQRRLLAVCGLSGAVGLISLHLAVKLIDPSDAVALIRTNVIIVALFSRVVLGEKFSLLQIGGLALTVAGVVFICQPTFLLKLVAFPRAPSPHAFINRKSNPIEKVDSFLQSFKLILIRLHTFKKESEISYTMPLLYDNSSNPSSSFYTGYSITNSNGSTLINPAGVLVALISALSSSFLSIFIKKLNNLHVHFSVVILYAAYFGLPASIIISIAMNHSSGYSRDMALISSPLQAIWQVGYSVVSAISGVAAQMVFNLALKHEETTKVMMVRSTDLLFVFLFQYAMLDIISNAWSMIGAFCILVSSILLIVIKYFERNYPSKCTHPCI